MDITQWIIQINFFTDRMIISLYQLVMLILPLARVVTTTSMLPGAIQKRRFHFALLLKTEDVMIAFFNHHLFSSVNYSVRHMKFYH